MRREIDTPEVIQAHLPAVIAACEQHGVAALWAFGSAVAGADDVRGSS